MNRLAYLDFKFFGRTVMVKDGKVEEAFKVMNK